MMREAPDFSVSSVRKRGNFMSLKSINGELLSAEISPLPSLFPSFPSLDIHSIGGKPKFESLVEVMYKKSI